MWGKEGTSKKLPAGLAFCQYCKTIETEAAPQRFLSWRTKGTSSQNPGSAPGSALSMTPGNEVRVQTSDNLPATEANLLRICRFRDWESHLAAEVISTEGSYLLCCGAFDESTPVN